MSEEDLGSATWTARRSDGKDTMLVRKCRLEVVAGPDAGASQLLASPVLVIGRYGLPFRQAKARVVEEFERGYVSRLLDAHGGNPSAVARNAGLDRMSVYKLLDRLRLRGRWKG